MNRRIMAVTTAAMILAAALWFPAQTAYASDLETRAGTAQIGVSTGLDGEIFDDTSDATGEESEGGMEPESEPTPEDVFPLGFSLGDGDTVQTNIIEVYEANLDNPENACFLEIGGDVKTLTLAATAWAQYERFRAVECEIGWRYDEFDSITSGRRMITGDILLPKGYAFQDEPLTVQSPVIVYDPDGPPTETVEYCDYTKTGLTRFLIPLGTERDALPDYFSDLAGRASIQTDNGDEFYCPLTLDLDAIDTDTAGVYYPIVLDLPSCVALDERKFYILGVHVLPADEVDLRAVTYWRTGYLVSWLYPIRVEPETILRVSVDGGDWFQCTTEYYSNGYVDYCLYNGVKTLAFQAKPLG